MNTENKHTGLGIPDGYFSDLEKNIFQEVESHELEKSLKTKFGDQAGFSVPENYFEKFNPLSNGSQKVFSISRVLKYSSAVAACLALLFFSGVFSEPSTEISDLNFNELLAEVVYEDIESMELFDAEELGTFLEENQDEQDLDEMLEYLLESEDDLEDFTIDILEI